MDGSSWFLPTLGGAIAGGAVSVVVSLIQYGVEKKERRADRLRAAYAQWVGAAYRTMVERRLVANLHETLLNVAARSGRNQVGEGLADKYHEAGSKLRAESAAMMDAAGTIAILEKQRSWAKQVADYTMAVYENTWNESLGPSPDAKSNQLFVIAMEKAVHKFAASIGDLHPVLQNL